MWIMDVHGKADLLWTKGWGLPRRKVDDWVGTDVLDLAHTTKSCLRPHRYSSVSPYTFFEVPVTEITHVQTLPVDHRLAEHDGRFYKYSPGRVVGGGWDREVTPITETTLFTGLRQRFVDGVPWEETVLRPDRYEPAHPNLSERYCGMSLDAFRDRCAYLEELHASLRANGYVRPNDRGVLDALALNVGRDGELIRNSEGIHRLILSRILGLDHVFARIHVVHPEAPLGSEREDLSHLLNI